MNKTEDTGKCDGCGLDRTPVQTVDVYDGFERYCIACAEVPGTTENRAEGK